MAQVSSSQFLFPGGLGLCMRESKTRKAALRTLPHPPDLSPGSELAKQSVDLGRWEDHVQPWHIQDLELPDIPSLNPNPFPL